MWLRRSMIGTWTCSRCKAHMELLAKTARRSLQHSVAAHQSAHKTFDKTETLDKTRNIGIIAHIDAGKTTTTERMLYYSGFTRRLGNVDEGSTVTDFLPAERARGITIQSAAITFHWPPRVPQASGDPFTINLIDTPGHADFTFEVIRSLRILDGAICILDGVAGVEAQTEKVWAQANNYHIPRILYVNKLDRDGASFGKTVKDIALQLHTFPLLCQIPWWRNDEFIGIGDVVNMRALEWQKGGDGSDFKPYDCLSLEQKDATFAAELKAARVALVESLSETDESMVNEFLSDANEDHLAVKPATIIYSLRNLLLSSRGQQDFTPVFAGASFRNIGVQPVLDAVNSLLPSPRESPDPHVTLGAIDTTLRALLREEALPNTQAPTTTGSNKVPSKKSNKTNLMTMKNLEACALAFKVVTDPRRGVLVYIRAYHGSIMRNALLYNTNLGVPERAMRLLRMYASEAVEIESIDEGQIGVITGLKHARTGDTLLVYAGSSMKSEPPAPLNSLQLRPIDVPAPVFFTSIEPNSLSEEKHLTETLALLLREDPSLKVTIDAESGQTQLSGMGELHLEIARDRLLNDFKVKASVGSIEIGYREAITACASATTADGDSKDPNKAAKAACEASVMPREDMPEGTLQNADEHVHIVNLADRNVLEIHHPRLSHEDDQKTQLPPWLSYATLISSLQAGTLSALVRGPKHGYPIHSCLVRLTFDQQNHLMPDSTLSAIASATRLAVQAALRASAKVSVPIMMEPVMLATISVQEEAMGAVVHDLSSSRGGQVLSLVARDDSADDANGVAEVRRLSTMQLQRLYVPPDPHGSANHSSSGMVYNISNIPRQIRARVPLKEMVGYLKQLRSLTGGRGSFVMSVDRFERMNAQRMKAALTEMHGSYI